MEALSKADLEEATQPKFKIGERIKPSPNSVFKYEVLKNPTNCIHNDQPAYLLKCLNPTIETPPFYRDQVTIELNWVSEDNPPFLYARESHVRHKKTQGIYKIVITPDKGRLEATGEPAYFYESLDDGLVWARGQVMMEDGRFEPVVVGSNAISH